MDEPIYHLPEEYDLEHARREPDVDFYLGLARRWDPRRILELGCGTGRVTIPLAIQTDAPARSVVGLDCVPEMLEAARKKAARAARSLGPRLRWVLGDLRTWRDEAPFDLIIAPCSTLCHLLELEDQRRAWETAFVNLAPGGHFVADVAMAELGVLAESLQKPPRALLEIDSDTSSRGPGGSKRLVRYRTLRYDASTQQASVRYLYDEFAGPDAPSRFLSDYESHVYYPRELELLFLLAGFRVESVWGDYRESPLKNDSRSLVMAGVKP